MSMTSLIWKIVYQLSKRPPKFLKIRAYLMATAVKKGSKYKLVPIVNDYYITSDIVLVNNVKIFSYNNKLIFELY